MPTLLVYSSSGAVQGLGWYLIPMKKRLSTTISTFRTLIREQCMYVDKTREIYTLVSQPHGQFFLSRPRRFGKSLTLSTLDAIFQGDRALFKGLYIDDQPYDWQPYPIIRLVLNACPASTVVELDRKLCMILAAIAEDYGIEITGSGAVEHFHALIRKLCRQHGPVVILIDEYDKPILDNILSREEVLPIRTFLKQFYGLIKALEDNIRFSLITGVSKFTQVSLFSDLNHLDDITMMPEYATLCGFTQEECEVYFAEWIDENATKNGLSREAYLDTLRRVYNGLRFTKQPVTVYNPVSFTKAMERGDFGHYWFETGTPSFLLELLQQQHNNLSDAQQGWRIPELDGIRLMSDAFSSYEVERLRVEPLLFQTGYLTITDYDPHTQLYTLGYPNDEVRFAFIKRLSEYFTPVPEARVPTLLDQLVHALHNHDLDGVFKTKL